jgi:hypothetical protein
VYFVVFHSLQDHLETGTHDFNHPISCQCKKHQQLARQEGGFAACFSLDVPMVPPLARAVATNGEHLLCDGFSLGETICFGSLEFITNCFGCLSLSPLGDGLDAIVMGPAGGGLSLLPWTMVGDSAEWFPTAPSGEGRTDLPSPRRHIAENWLADQATMTIPPGQETPWIEANLPLKRQRACWLAAQ